MEPISDNYAPGEIDYLRAQVYEAPRRRSDGGRALRQIQNFNATAARKAEIAGIDHPELMRRMYANNPELTNRLKSYVWEQGMTPASNFDDLAIQASHARQQQIAEIQDHYDPDNFDADNFIFGKKNKAARQQRRQIRQQRKTARQTAKTARRAQRDTNRMQRLTNKNRTAQAQADADVLAAQQPPLETDYGQYEDTGAQYEYPTQDPTVTTSMMGDPDSQEVLALASPTADEAHAEVLGMEMEDQAFDGEFDMFIPAIGGAIEAGTQIMDKLKAQGVDLSNIYTLLGKRKPAVKTPQARPVQMPYVDPYRLQPKPKMGTMFTTTNVIIAVVIVAIIYMLSRKNS